MTRITSLTRRVAALLVCAAISACDTADTATPVASATVTPAQPQVKPGTVTTLTYRFTVADDAPAFTENYSVFLHASGADGQLWADDHQPQPPTREWKPGMVVEYTRDMLIPPGVPSTNANLNVGLYAPASGERLPLGGQSDGKRTYRVGTLQLLAADPAPLFVSGWNNLEGDGSVEWRWTKASSVVALRNPRQDSTLVVVVDQPAPLPRAQPVSIQVGETPVEQFAVSAGTREIRRIPVVAAALGEQNLVRITIDVAETFVPREVASMKNPDTRELGVRVFATYFEVATP